MTDSTTRTRIRELVSREPGVHVNAIQRRLDIGSGQVQYHLRRLVDADELRAEPRYGRTHYFPPDYEPWDRHAVSVLRRETARDIASTVVAQEPVSPASVAEDLDIARSTLEYHLDHLIAADVVRKHHDDTGRVTLTTPHPLETVRLLDVVTPTLPDRLVDRFERLVDSI